ncbi:hypothetical protein G4B88_009556 [Cannabis sativa]|uniref:Translation elongation factor EFTs/EF1B dimerisation domain-containing protein n=1 Tax=Cannabis sativa TaxID=3483 RepID=A0A7J6E8U2_CANSA|nr:hypothetical protein G4B88_009556 [Cannabis sativa]
MVVYCSVICIAGWLKKTKRKALFASLEKIKEGERLISMAFLRGARRSLGPILYNRVFTSSGSTSTTFATSRHKFSTWAFTKRGSLDESTQTKISIPAVIHLALSSPSEDSVWELLTINAEAAQKDLRKRGKVLASKKSSRTATEGMLALAQNGNRAALIELNCETDFVARNEIFQHLALALAKQALISNSSSEQASGILPVRPDYLEGFSIVTITLSLGRHSISSDVPPPTLDCSFPSRNCRPFFCLSAVAGEEEALEIWETTIDAPTVFRDSPDICPYDDKDTSLTSSVSFED